jgi:hypothetical protein
LRANRELIELNPIDLWIFCWARLRCGLEQNFFLFLCFAAKEEKRFVIRTGIASKQFVELHPTTSRRIIFSKVRATQKAHKSRKEEKKPSSQHRVAVVNFL